MAQCPGCGQSYCLDCEKSVDPRVFRCDPCLQEHVATDSFAISAREAELKVSKLRKQAKIVHDLLEQLQPVVHGSKDDHIREVAFHAVIDIRDLVRKMLSEEVPTQ